ncbi:hypothetical protein D9V32_05735 [Mycetocola tolaasinivorans]|uniref:Uncharacterized protein n=1 Tax=Mycetocola tolaasinivorans TaxID=76635 RepID=A0A3L7A9T6_9MICO|nr:hypothetical protein [Mycetocola tolaasinivorans]RLP76371.1 hypothetical protein D9V32_05735 [Mycetocola tolaasinivorans]
MSLTSLIVLSVTSPTPNPSPTRIVTPDANLVTPGPGGFLAMIAIVLVVFFLIWDMVRRVRRVNYRAEIVERLEAEKAELDAAEEAKRSGAVRTLPDTDTDTDPADPERPTK